MRELIKTLLDALFRVLFVYECEGAHNVPTTGGAVVAANHPSYLDPILVSLGLGRPVRFMAWDALFRVPVLGALMRSFGAFPVDVRRGQGRQAYEEAKRLVRDGEVIGIFPEGRRSQTGWMEPALREGAARLAWETGAPLVPATIVGAFRAWPHFQSFPWPARIKVRFHDPISPVPFSNLPEAEALPALLAELRLRVERTLLPGVKADLRYGVVYRLPSPWPRLYETVPVLGLALLVFWKTQSIPAVLPCYAYIGYLLLDHFLIPQRRLTKRLRNLSPVLFALGYGPRVLAALGLPPVLAGGSLAAITLGALFPYLYERGRTALGVIRGLVFAFLVELGVLHWAPSGTGVHLAVPLFLAAYAWERRTVFWGYAVPVLLGYAVLVPRALLMPGADVLPHVIGGLVAWLLARMIPDRMREPAAPEPERMGLGLDLDSRD